MATAGDLGGRQPTQLRVWPDFVVVVPPGVQDMTGTHPGSCSGSSPDQRDCRCSRFSAAASLVICGHNACRTKVRIGWIVLKKSAEGGAAVRSSHRVEGFSCERRRDRLGAARGGPLARDFYNRAPRSGESLVIGLFNTIGRLRSKPKKPAERPLSHLSYRELTVRFRPEMDASR